MTEFQNFVYSLAKCDRTQLLNNKMAEFVFNAGMKEGRKQYEHILENQREYYKKHGRKRA